MSNNPSKFLGQLEKEVMEIVWVSKEPVTVRSIFEIISKKRKIAYTTVMTIMGRLAKKGLLKKEVSGKIYYYHAAYSKDKFLIKLSRQILNNLTSSFGDAAVAHFAEEVDRLPEAKKLKLIQMLKNSK